MRPDGNNNPNLDLNNFPEDYGKLPVEESSTTTAASTEAMMFKKKKNGGKDDGKIYECRFCSLKFCKSQALGGHMNRHRQERETETLNRARQLVFGNEELSGPGDHHLGNFHMGMSSTHGCQARGGIGEPCLPYRPVYPMLGATQTSQNIYPSQTQPLPYPSPYSSRPPPIGEYFVGHVISSSSQRPMSLQSNYGNDSNNYTCFGAPLNVSNRFSMEGGFHAPTTRESTSGNQDYRRDRPFDK